MEKFSNSLYRNEFLNTASGNDNHNQLREAISRFESEINTNSKNYDAYFSLGALYEKLNDTDRAKDVYLKGISNARNFQDKTAEIDFSFTLLGLMELTM